MIKTHIMDIVIAWSVAHDTKLDRSVAIKSLPASVNHPSIATISEELEEEGE